LGAALWAGVAGAASPFGADIHIGTTGVGVNGQYRLGDDLALRGFADMHPFKNSFLISGGAYFGDRNVSLDATPKANVVVNGVALAPAQVGAPHGEGPDDMPAHIRAALTPARLSIPLLDGRLALGTWRGVYPFEHRLRPHSREIAVHLLGE
jgi:hypothetical protein